MTHKALRSIPLPLPVDLPPSPSSTAPADDLVPQDEAEKAVLVEIGKRNEARKAALLPLLDVAKEFRHFRENRDLIEYSRFLAAHIDIFERLEAKHYARWCAAHPLKRDFVEVASMAAHRTIGYLMTRQQRKRAL